MVAGYFVIASIVFCFWFTKFWGDTTTPKDDRISWAALIIGPLLWPIVLPLSIKELATKKRQEAQAIEPSNPTAPIEKSEGDDSVES